MKRILGLIFFTLLLVTPAAAQGDKTLPETFVSDDERMTLRYPLGWVAVSESDGEAIIATDPSLIDFNGDHIPSGEAAMLIVFPTVNDDFLDAQEIYVSGEPLETLSRIIDSLKDENTTLPLRFSEPEVTTIGGENAARAEGTVGDNSAVLLVIDYGDDVFSFMIGVTASGEMPKYLPKLVAIAESVNIAGS